MKQFYDNRHNIDPTKVAPLVKAARLEKDLLHWQSTNRRSQKKSGSELVEAFLRSIPKAELHLHGTAMTDIFGIAPLAWKISKRVTGVCKESQLQRISRKAHEEFFEAQTRESLRLSRTV